MTTGAMSEIESVKENGAPAEQLPPQEKTKHLLKRLLDAGNRVNETLKAIKEKERGGEVAVVNYLDEKITALLSARDMKRRDELEVNKDYIDNLTDELHKMMGEKDVEEYHQSIQDLLETYEQRGSIERIGRQVVAGEIVERFEEVESAEDVLKFKPEELMTMSSAIERKNWNALLRLKAGEGVVVFTEPLAQSTKKLNDELFGWLKTDEINGKRNELLRTKIVERCGGLVARMEQNFKNSFFKISAESGDRYDEVVAELNAVCTEVDNEMRIFIAEAITAELARLDPKTDQRKREMLEKFRDNENTAYRMGFGVEKVETAPDKELVAATEAIVRAWSGSLISRTSLQEEGVYGERFNEEKLQSELHQNDALREELRQTKKITDASGKSFDIFTEKDGFFVLSDDLLRELRKGTFAPAKDEQVVFDKIKTYHRRLNLMDVIKPYMLGELESPDAPLPSGEKLADRLVAEQMAADALSELITERKQDKDVAAVAEKVLASKETIVKALTTSRDGVFSSDAIFHQEASKMKSCTYIAFDVLNVGVYGLQEADKLAQHVTRGDMSLEEALLQSGDTISRKLRDFRQRVLAVGSNYGLDRLPTFVGGDEMTIAVDGARISEEKLASLVIEFYNDINTTVKTRVVVARTDKKILTADETKNSVAGLVEHVRALKHSEAEIAVAKSLEKGLRDLEAVPSEWVADDEAEYIKLQAIEKAGFVIDEEIADKRKTGQLIVRTTVPPGLFYADALLASLNHLLKKKKR